MNFCAPRIRPLLRACVAAFISLQFGVSAQAAATGALDQATPPRDRVPVSAKAPAASTAAPKTTKVSTKARATKTATRTAVKRKAAVAKKPTARRTTSRRLSRRAREEAEARTPRFRLDEQGQTVPDVRAEAAIIYNPTTGQVVWANHERDPRSIASITKVMTAVVSLEHETDTTRIVTVERRDLIGASVTYLRSNDRLSVETLLHLTLIASDNGAARTLARVSPFGTEGFIARMNAKAVELGLQETTYADPSGLNPDNISSAFDMARLISFASGNERIAGIMRKDGATLAVGRRNIVVRSTNKLLGTDGVEVRAGKTGFIRRAGYCLATLLKLPQGDQLAVVVLGARSSAGRFWETRHLVNWVTARLGATEAPAQEPDR